jgi:hypothetical protein
MMMSSQEKHTNYGSFDYLHFQVRLPAVNLAKPAAAAFVSSESKRFNTVSFSSKIKLFICDLIALSTAPSEYNCDKRLRAEATRFLSREDEKRDEAWELPDGDAALGMIGFATWETLTAGDSIELVDEPQGEDFTWGVVVVDPYGETDIGIVEPCVDDDVALLG